MSNDPQASAVLELDNLAKSILPTNGRFAAAFDFARSIASKAAYLAPLFGGADGLIEKAQALYDQYCAPYDIPGLEEDTEEAIDAAAKLVIRDFIRNAASVVG
jgi:hypothetical protein